MIPGAPDTLSPDVAVRVDGRHIAVPAGTSLADLVARLGHEPQAVATAIGGRFVARTARTARLLQAGDDVLLFRPVSGG